ncbi:MAG: peptide-methionine (S)-S-oxide reductase MsrA [Firmicutes bacterium]|nr:peptide-methionine (S)-S-oxide reductase MsrA [Bacillota bacterium]MBR0114812.1 peptide-methionine (S)-S-oxide reductase MsrA [Bacillota bacterium]
MRRYAYFAGGCFWCITPIFKLYDGVISVTSGYSGGDEDHPRYEDVKAQKTGHRETIRVEYEEGIEIDFPTLMDIYLANIDPYDAEGQFIDKGFSYTLAVYYTDEEQERIAREKIDALEKARGKRTEIALEPFKSFWEAEEYHQDYHEKNPEAFEKELEESGRKEYFSEKQGVK